MRLAGEVGLVVRVVIHMSCASRGVGSGPALYVGGAVRAMKKHVRRGTGRRRRRDLIWARQKKAGGRVGRALRQKNISDLRNTYSDPDIISSAVLALAPYSSVDAAGMWPGSARENTSVYRRRRARPPPAGTSSGAGSLGSGEDEGTGWTGLRPDVAQVAVAWWALEGE